MNINQIYLFNIKMFTTWLYHNWVKYEWGKATPPYGWLCFTANTAGSTVQLAKVWTPIEVSLEISNDWNSWSDYTIWNTITLANIWDKVYIRNKSEEDTRFSVSPNYCYRFYMDWSIAASGDISYLLNKNWTLNTSNNCLCDLFYNCVSLTSSPKFLFTEFKESCFYEMFRWCSNLEVLPKLYWLTMWHYCCQYMFYWCSKIKISTTKTWEYQTEYRIPTTWTWSTYSMALSSMFTSTGWTFTWTPNENTTYYTSNTVV